MDKIIDQITDSLALTDTAEDKSLSIFDENDNEVYAIGKPKVTEPEAATIRRCITASWAKSTRIKVGKCNFLCLRVSKTLLGYGNFNELAIDETVGDSKTLQEKDLECYSNEKQERDKTSNGTMREIYDLLCNNTEKRKLDKDSYGTIQAKDYLGCRNAGKQKLDKVSNGKVTLTSAVFEGFLVILMGRNMAGESIMKQTKGIVDMLSNISMDKI